MAKILKFPGKRARAGQKHQMTGSLIRNGYTDNVIPLGIPFGSGNRDLPDFTMFHEKIVADDLVTGGELLSFLLGVSHFNGIESARMYRYLNRTTGQGQEKLKNLQEALEQEKNNECLMLLASCFGIDGARAVLVLQHLKSQS